MKKHWGISHTFLRFVFFAFTLFSFLGASLIYTPRPAPPSDSFQKERQDAAKLPVESSTPTTSEISFVDRESEEGSVDDPTPFTSSN
jgi:hypothetical protein